MITIFDKKNGHNFNFSLLLIAMTCSIIYVLAIRVLDKYPEITITLLKNIL